MSWLLSEETPRRMPATTTYQLEHHLGGYQPCQFVLNDASEDVFTGSQLPLVLGIKYLIAIVRGLT
jgi:hypothetical protein